VGHIAKAMRDTEEVDKNDWVTAVNPAGVQ